MRKVAVTLLTSPEPAEPPPFRRKEAAVVILAAGAVGAWIFAFLMRRFLGLGTTYDLYLNVQLATSWLEGRFLQENLFGNYLAVHAYFLSPVLAVLAYPFGAPGLLLAAGLGAAAGVVAMVKILRLFDVSGRVALPFAVGLTLMPLSLQVYQVDFYGFQIELLIPGLALWLAYFLLRRQWTGSLLLGLALQALKEDSALILIAVTAAVIGEDFLRSLAAGSVRHWRKTWNFPALTVAGLSVLLTPLLIQIVKSQQAVRDPRLGHFAKVHAVDHSTFSGVDSIASYMMDHLPAWLQSGTVALWLAAVMAGTCGLALLRPHLLVIGLLTTLTAWLSQSDLLWAPRFAPTLAFVQLTACLSLGSLWRTVRGYPGSGWPRGWINGALLAVLALALGLGLSRQYRLAPLSSEVYRMAPALKISPAERRQADELFAVYRREARPEEPVVASEYLYRYLHDRNFFWILRMKGRPKPRWILWDQQDRPLSDLWLYLRTDAGWDISDYELVGQKGRFLLYRAWDARPIGPAPAPRPVAGEPDGMIRMKVQFAPGRAGTSEPILSLGAPGRGQLFFVHYLDERKLVLGLDSVGLSVQLGQPVDYLPGQTYEMEWFSESLLSPPAGDAGPAPGTTHLLRYKNVVRVAMAGQVVLSTFAPSHRVVPQEIYPGFNFVRSGSAVSGFSGKLEDIRRGGYPALAEGEAQAFGAVRLEVRLPENATGGAEAVEPMVVAGVSGDATIGYVRMLQDGRIKVGVDFWSFGAFESEPLTVDRTKPVNLTYAFPVLFPPPGDPRWGEVPAVAQEKLRTWLQITVNDAVVVDRGVAAPIPRQPTVAYGKNPAGGSVVAAEFKGQVLQVSREPLVRP